MNKLGKLLRKYREEINMSLKNVSDITGITDSRLSKIENGKCSCPASDLKKLAELYHVPVVTLFLTADYLKPEDLKEYQQVFKGTEYLNDQEKQHVQVGIDLLVGKKETSL